MIIPYRIINTSLETKNNEMLDANIVLMEQPDSNYSQYLNTYECIVIIMKKNKFNYVEFYMKYKSISVLNDTITPLAKEYNVQDYLYLGKFDLYNYNKNINKITIKDFILSEKGKYIQIHTKK